METTNYRVIVFTKSGTIFDKTIRADTIEHQGELLCLIKEKKDVLLVPTRYSIIEKV